MHPDGHAVLSCVPAELPRLTSTHLLRAANAGLAGRQGNNPLWRQGAGALRPHERHPAGMGHLHRRPVSRVAFSWLSQESGHA